jgi:uncharacterized membrane protein
MAHALTVTHIDAPPRIRRIHLADIRDALARGIDDFLWMPSHALMLSLIYPIVGLLLVRIAIDRAVMPLVFPIMAGFSLLGPFAALGFYERSRRRELRLSGAAKDVVRGLLKSPSLIDIAALGLCLTAVFLFWLIVAQAIYQMTFGYAAAEWAPFLRDLFTTSAGWTLIVVGNGIGFLFAVLVLAVGVVSFPLLLDRPIGLSEAVRTSCRVVAANPIPMAAWGLVVAAGLVLGSVPLLFGLAAVVPVLGHATWHLYRKVVAFD